MSAPSSVSDQRPGSTSSTSSKYFFVVVFSSRYCFQTGSDLACSSIQIAPRILWKVDPKLPLYALALQTLDPRNSTESSPPIAGSLKKSGCANHCALYMVRYPPG